METPLLVTPPDNSVHSFVQLGYIAAYDAPLNCDFAFLAYKETDKDSGRWRVRIRSTQTVEAVLEAPMIANKARETGAQGKPFFLWGYKLEPSAADQRHIEFRVYQAVSYTHLRAHETVLDLVCRLLLEKKKSINKQVVTCCHT